MYPALAFACPGQALLAPPLYATEVLCCSGGLRSFHYEVLMMVGLGVEVVGGVVCVL